jgi:hypothetical protein
MFEVSPRTYDIRCEFCSGADRNADAAALVTPESSEFELDAIGVFGVPTLRGAVIACTDERSEIGESLTDPFELEDGAVKVDGPPDVSHVQHCEVESLNRHGWPNALCSLLIPLGLMPVGLPVARQIIVDATEGALHHRFLGLPCSTW